MYERPFWDDYFMDIAAAVSMRGDCTRRRVGCVIVDSEMRIIGTGYNAAESGGPSCLKGECPRGLNDQPRTEDYSNCVAIHAEASALISARVSCRGARAYVTELPCIDCSKLLRGAGIGSISVRSPVLIEAPDTVIRGVTILRPGVAVSLPNEWECIKCNKGMINNGARTVYVHVCE